MSFPLEASQKASKAGNESPSAAALPEPPVMALNPLLSKKLSADSKDSGSFVSVNVSPAASMDGGTPPKTRP
eukprot:CAMPEP_0173458112 /NCGR_PEP_ID=MMETSP1357-20121228/58973_1 /TAXON_ID=77926 /ORGANISM="Hemiselmis rufescens, Strain PCC563" /LENGTH=71 /DNA_ID=CAMNT_0014425455 /DNA_START=12 /DNA_END=223 /DNA_ORIENTATION=-